MDKEYLISAEFWDPHDNDEYYSVPIGVCHMEAEAKVWLDALRNHEDWAWKAVYKIFGENIDIPYNLMFCIKPVEVLSFSKKHPNT